nr:hypothetical protein BSM_22460 [uncultured archaeon]
MLCKACLYAAFVFFATVFHEWFSANRLPLLPILALTSLSCNKCIIASPSSRSFIGSTKRVALPFSSGNPPTLVATRGLAIAIASSANRLVSCQPYNVVSYIMYVLHN